jgi:hypothetical protein
MTAALAGIQKTKSVPRPTGNGKVRQQPKAGRSGQVAGALAGPRTRCPLSLFDGLGQEQEYAMSAEDDDYTAPRAQEELDWTTPLEYWRGYTAEVFDDALRSQVRDLVRGSADLGKMFFDVCCGEMPSDPLGYSSITSCSFMLPNRSVIETVAVSFVWMVPIAIRMSSELHRRCAQVGLAAARQARAESSEPRHDATLRFIPPKPSPSASSRRNEFLR